MPDPLTAASNAVGAYTQQKNENRDKALAAATERARLAMQGQVLDRQREAQERAQALEAQRLDETHRHNLEAEQHQRVTEAIQAADAQARQAYEKAHAALDQELQKGADARNAILKAQLQSAQIKAQHEAELMRAQLNSAQAKAHAAMVDAQYAEEIKRAQLTRTQSESARAQSSIETDATRRRLMETQMQRSKELNRATEAKMHAPPSGRAILLREKIRQIQKANPGVTTQQLRAAAKQDGYDDATINTVLPGG